MPSKATGIAKSTDVNNELTNSQAKPSKWQFQRMLSQFQENTN